MKCQIILMIYMVYTTSHNHLLLIEGHWNSCVDMLSPQPDVCYSPFCWCECLSVPFLIPLVLNTPWASSIPALLFSLLELMIFPLPLQSFAQLYLSLTTPHDKIQACIMQEMLHGLFHTFISFAEYKHWRQQASNGSWEQGTMCLV